MKTKLKQLIAVVLSMAMCLSLLSANVWAAEDSEGASVFPQSSEEPAPEEESVPAEDAPEEVSSTEESSDSTEESSTEESVSAEEETALTPQGIAASGTCGENVNWTLDDAGKLTISGTGTMDDYFYEADNYPGWYAYKDTIQSAVIEVGVTRIGSEAFRECTSLMSITIPNSVTSIGEEAFQECSNLTGITIPNSVTRFGWSVFSECSNLKSITIPNSVTRIENFMFDLCSSLMSVTIPNSVTSIGDEAFDRCRSLTSITIPNSVTSIGDCAFKYCTNLTSVIIPNSVSNIGYAAFSDCGSIKNITIPEGVTSIDGYAFSYCTSLSSVTIPNSVTSIGYNAFLNCHNLSDVYYKGSEDNWNLITTDSGIEKLSGATIHYNSSSQDDYQDTGSFSSDNLPQYPSDGKDEWVIFKEGSRNNRVEMSTFTLTSNSSNMRIVWNKGLSVSGSSTIDSCNQYYLSTEGKWAYLGEYGLLSDWATGVIASSLDVYDNNGNLIIERSDIYRKNSSYIDKSKIWSFANWRTEFPMASNGYYMSDEDFKKLMGGLNNIDRKLVAGDLMYHAAHTDFVGYTTEGIWTEKINVGSRGRPHTDKETKDGNTSVWNGSCYGMSTLAILINSGKIMSDCINSDAHSVSEIESDSRAATAINFYHVQQRTTYVSQKRDEMIEIGKNRGQIAQLRLLEEQAKKSNETGSLFLIAYSWFNGDDAWKISGHAVIGYGYESGSWLFDGIEYKNRILVYDCGHPYNDQDRYFIYYNNNGTLTIPGRNLRSNAYNKEKNKENNGALELISDQDEALECVNYLTGKPTSENAYTNLSNYIITKIGDCLTIKDLNGDKDVWHIQTNGYTKNSRGILLNTFIANYDDSGSNDNEQIIMLPYHDHSYQIISEDQNLDCQIVFGNYLADVSCNSAGSIDISPQGDITVSTETKAYINLEITSNTYYGAEDWYTVQVHAEDASGIKVNQSEGGVSVQSDAEKPVHLAAGTDSEYAETYSDNTNKGVVFTPDSSGSGIEENQQNGSNNTEDDDNTYRYKNTINSVNFITRAANEKKNQSFNLNASANSAKLSYKSNNKNVTVKNGKVTIKKGFVGKVTITITSAETEKYLPAMKKVTVTVNPSTTQISSVKWNKKKKVANVVWKKNTTGKGYQLQCSTSKNFKKNVKTWKIKDKKTVKASIKGLKKGTYYLRIRTVNGKCYSKWSKTKTIKIAK